MCVSIDKNVKPASINKRKEVYKVVYKYIDTDKNTEYPYSNIFDCATKTVFILGVEAISSRVKKNLSPYEQSHLQIYTGFHVLLTVSTARKLVKSLSQIAYNSWNLVSFSFSDDWKFAILKCNVEPENHVADGLYDIGLTRHKFVKATVYHKITPIEEVK